MILLARTLGTQLDASEDYQHLRASEGLHLLDFDLLTANEKELQQATSATLAWTGTLMLQVISH